MLLPRFAIPSKILTSTSGIILSSGPFNMMETKEYNLGKVAICDQKIDTLEEQFVAKIIHEPPKDRYHRQIHEALEAHNAGTSFIFSISLLRLLMCTARALAPGPKRSTLEWSQLLADEAQKYADYMASHDSTPQDQINVWKHDPNRPKWQGENLYSRKGHGYAELKVAVNSWNDEKRYYNGEKVDSEGLHKYGHFTQNVWPGTKKVGMAQRYSAASGWQYIVARYWPQGNFLGESAYEPSKS